MLRLAGHRLMTPVVLMLCLVLCSCVGPFNLTANVLHWNNSIESGKGWVEELVFIVFVWLPVYGICVLGDAIIFNSIEFWGGENPIVAPPDWRDTRAAPAKAPALAVVKNDRGGADAQDASGNVVLSSEVLPDGTVVFRNAAGLEVSRFAPEQAKAVRDSLSKR